MAKIQPEIQNNETIDVQTTDEVGEQVHDVRELAYGLYERDVLQLLQAIAYRLEQIDKRLTKDA